jgi:hypothetical protein
MEAFGEDGSAAVRVEAKDAPLGGVGGGADVHRVLGNKDAAVGSDGDDGGMLDVRCLGDEVEGPAGDRDGREGLLGEAAAGEEDQEGDEDLNLEKAVGTTDCTDDTDTPGLGFGLPHTCEVRV